MKKTKFFKNGINYFVFYIILKVGKTRISFNNENYIGTHDIYFKTSKSYIKVIHTVSLNI